MFPAAVALRDRASGRYLAIGAAWISGVRDALAFAQRDAADVVRRFTCEPDAVELVDLGDACCAVA